eukprot:1320106-Rhodomonas_salina.3
MHAALLCRVLDQQTSAVGRCSRREELVLQAADRLGGVLETKDLLPEPASSARPEHTRRTPTFAREVLVTDTTRDCMSGVF